MGKINYNISFGGYRRKIREDREGLPDINLINPCNYLNITAELRYTNEHEWIRVEGDVAYVGITDYAQSELGEIVFVDINTEGETVGQNEVFGSVEAVKTVSDLNMPVTGEVLEVNETINDQPELVNNDPYGEGWMIKIQVANPAELDTLLDAEAYKALIG